MNILVTGAGGFVGRNLVENLKNIRDGKNRTRPALSIGKIYEYTRANTDDDLERFCADCDFVFNLRYSFGLGDVKKDGDGTFNALSFTVGYKF